MRYRCTIFTHAYTTTGTEAFSGTEPSFDEPMGDAVVRADGMRHAAARAWVRLVGRERARVLAGSGESNPDAAAQQANARAIAASLRKTCKRIGEVFELDNLVESWFIKVEPAPSKPPRLRLSSSRLLRLLRNPSPN